MQQVQDRSATVSAAPSEHPDSHYQHLGNTLPDWLGQVSPAQRQALKATPPRLADGLKAASPEQHQTLQTLTAAHWSAQSAVDKRLEHLQDASAFAEPLLRAALKNQFGLDLDVRNTWLRLYVPVNVPGFALKTGARAWSVSLLDAALHNFDAQESEDDAYEAHSCFISAPTPTGQFDTLPQIKQTLSIPAFIKLCRTLDIGAQYQACLKESLGFSEPVGAAVLRLKIDASEQAALRAALQWARMNGDLDEQYLRLIGGLLDGLQGMRINGQALRCHDLTMMSASLTGIVLFAPDLERSREAVPVVAYVPGDPEHPVKQYGSSAEMAAELIRQLRSAPYQQFFSRFVAHEKRGVFFATLNTRLSTLAWHEPVAGSALPSWRPTPVEKPDLQFTASLIDGDLWRHLYQGKLNKILNDARTLAVSTASADRKARWALWDSFVDIASEILQTAAFIVAPFVPGLGELMMAYMAYQLLDETFEGVIDWTLGQTREGFEHLMGAVESLVQLGVFAAGAAIGAGEYRKVLPSEVVAFIDRFKPVTLANGKTRYWKPDLKAYEHPAPAARTDVDALGLRAHQGKQLLPIDQAHYAVSQNPITGQYHIEHPTRPDAYRPPLHHNGDGAWHTELEQPLEWDTSTAMRRIGHSVEGFSDARRERILQVSGCSEDALRKMHVNQQSLPPLLADSIKRFQIDRDLERFIGQLDSESPEQYLLAEPSLLLQLLKQHPRWPADKPLQFIEAGGYDLTQGDLLQTLLQTLDDSEIKTLLGEGFGDPTPSLDSRTRALRKQLVDLAREHRTSLFESRYQSLEQTQDPRVRQIVQHDPHLPLSVARELADTATGEELQQIRQGQLPARQQALIELANQEVRVTRAFEGLELDSVSNPDTETLALHSLQHLPGWTHEVRIEVRDGSYEGRRLDSAGAAQAPLQKILVRQADGRYQPFDDRGQALHSVTDFYSSILYALPDSERQALNLHIGQGQQLKAAIRERPLARSELRVAISHPPVQAPVLDTLRLVTVQGYRRLLRTVPTSPEHPFTLEQRAQALFPGYSMDQIDALLLRLRSHPDGARAVLSRLRSEFARLAEDLGRWVNQTPTVNRQGGVLTEAQYQDARQARRLFKDSLLQCWRRETRNAVGYVLFVPGSIPGELPPLSADFAHVASLQINGSSGTTGLDGFLQNLPGLVHLEMVNFELPGLPQAITAMPELRQLVARNCALSLSPSDQRILASSPLLSLLDLQNNPLAHAPDLQAIPTLREVNLAATGIRTVPADLLDHPQLIIGNFSNNAITELPEPLYALGAELSNGYCFADNPLSTDTRERIRRHYLRTGTHFAVLPEHVDIVRAGNLFPQMNVGQVTDLLYRLPGTLAEGREQLTRWEAELTVLVGDLSRWENDTPERDPATHRPLNINERFTEQVAREDFARSLESFWRYRFSDHPERFRLELKFIGDLPALSADFSHVPLLTFVGNPHIGAIDPFLQRFPGLRGLHLKNFTLNQLPPALARMPKLRTLSLDHCHLTLPADGQLALAAPHMLGTLELANNPLGSPPDLTRLPALTYLDLSQCGLSTIPVGLAGHAELMTAVLSGNRITALPDEFFTLSAAQVDGLDFAHNPLSLATRERIKSYFQDQREDLGVRADEADIRQVQQLFPTLDEEDASDVIYDLPGTLQEGREHLQRWASELTQLIDTFAAWVKNVPEHHPVSGEPLNADQRFTEQRARMQFSQDLERYWRSRPDPEQKRADTFVLILNFCGDLPPITADFGHVTSLSLAGNPGVLGSERFLERFPNLHTLDLHDFALDRVPPGLTQMSALRELIMTRCQLPLTPEDQAVLSSLDGLEALDLSDNPLTVAPDITGLPLLHELRLSNTGIDQLPKGLTDLEHLKIATLHSNRIAELPDDLFSVDSQFAEGINLSHNPLSADSREQIKIHYAATGHDFAVPAGQAEIGRVQALFRLMDKEDASHVIYKLPGTLEDGRAQLARWEAEISQLTEDLDHWTQDVPARHPLLGHTLGAPEIDAELIARQHFAQQLEQFWRQRVPNTPELRDNTFIAEPSFIGEMPALTADFSHVSLLSLKGHDALRMQARFLDCFSGLQHLELRHFDLGRIPSEIARIPTLEFLVLGRCGVVFDDEGQAVLGALPRLKMLDLFDNPLGRAPDLTPLKTLTFIDFSGTGIERMPPGVASLPELNTALLRDNLITELPPALYQLPGANGDGFDLTNNPLSEATLEHLKTYWQRTGSDLGASAAPADIEHALALYPGLDSIEASHLIFALPGTLAEGRVELARRQTELGKLIDDLDAWVADISHHPTTGEPLEAAARAQEQERRRAFKDSLEQCWRTLPVENRFADELSFKFNASFFGDLPVLTADFGNVQELYLSHSGPHAPRIGRFLEHFPNLTRLAIRGYRLQRIPDAIFNMRQLTALSLPECHITLDRVSVDALAGLHDLDSLNLRGNPLGLAPDLSHMQDLTSLDLSHTGLTVMPKGLLANHGLLSAQLSYNAITQVPIELTQAAAHFTQGFDLRGNPLSAQSLERIAAHFRETGNTLGIDGLTQRPRADDPANGIDMEH